jgi:hypothetical protein
MLLFEQGAWPERPQIVKPRATPWDHYQERGSSVPQSLAQVLVHLVFSTKNREPLLSDDIRPELHPYLATILKGMDDRTDPACCGNEPAD